MQFSKSLIAMLFVSVQAFSGCDNIIHDIELAGQVTQNHILECQKQAGHLFARKNSGYKPAAAPKPAAPKPAPKPASKPAAKPKAYKPKVSKPKAPKPYKPKVTKPKAPKVYKPKVTKPKAPKPTKPYVPNQPNPPVVTSSAYVPTPTDEVVPIDDPVTYTDGTAAPTDEVVVDEPAVDEPVTDDSESA